MSAAQCRDLNELHPKVKELAEQLIAECKKQGLNVLITETYRSVERQDALYAQGRTTPGIIVTNARGSDMSSYHQWRLAFDFCQNIRGKEYDTTFMNKVGAIGTKLGLEWGGSWTTFKDTPHFQYTYGLTIKQLKAGAKIPSYTPNSTSSVTNSVTNGKTITQTKIKLNGVIKTVNTVLHNGNNFIRLRDLSDSKIEIGYDSSKMPTVTVKATNPVSTTLINSTKVYPVNVTKTKIKLNGVVKEVETILIDNTNYIKLRDLTDSKLSVNFDTVSKMPVVTAK